jgi:predicted nucleic acid-binding protein
MSKVFVDTNILVYSMDKHDLQKMKKSRSMLKKLKTKMHGVISTQELQEFYVVAIKKLKADPINVKDIRQINYLTPSSCPHPL